MNEELLLTPEEIKEALKAHGAQYGGYDAYNIPSIITKAQLAKAEPSIRKDERERIMGQLKRSHRGTDGWLFIATKDVAIWQALKGEE